MTESSGRRSTENGFTLVEMMVAIVIFGMLAAAGTAILAASVDGQAAVAKRIDAVAGLRRANALLTQDLAQALARPTRDSGGRTVPAFESARPPILFSVVRSGVGAGGDVPVVEVRRVTWRIDGNRLMRAVSPGLDGADEGVATPVMDGIASIAARYRGPDGWRSDWSADKPELLPSAVEVAITDTAGREIVQRIAVGTTVGTPR